MKKRRPLDEVHKDINFDLEDNSPLNEDNGLNVVGNLDKNKIVDIPINEIEVENNIRDSYEDSSLEELGDSLLENGQIQPIIVTKKAEHRYAIKIGHRRYKACLLRDIPVIKCIIEDDFKSDKERIIFQAVENEQRLNLSSREREKYIAKLIDLGLTQVEIAKELHKSKGWVSEALTSYKFVNDNKELFDGLSEEPSTRDVWKASKLSENELKDAFKMAKKNGGTKEAVKKEVDKRYKEISTSKISNSEKRVFISNEITINEDKREVFIKSSFCHDKNLSETILRTVTTFYENKNFLINVI